MGKLSKEKGKRGEREVAALLREHGFAGQRGVQYQGGKDSADVLGLPGFHLEVKFVERFDLKGSMQQARDDAGGCGIPVVFHRSSREPWITVIGAEDFLRMVKWRDTMAARIEELNDEIRTLKEEEF